MPFELMGLDFVGREGREEDMSGVDEVGNIWGSTWKSIKKHAPTPGKLWKGTKLLATGKAFRHKRKGSPVIVESPGVPSAPRHAKLSMPEIRLQREGINEQAITEAMTKYGLTGKTTLTEAELESVADDAASRIIPQESSNPTQTRAVAKSRIKSTMRKMRIIKG